MNRMFERYIDVLLKWNARINLTALTDRDIIRARHIADSLEPAALLSECSSLIDLGTGAGFPGIPLKIACPRLSVVVLDATRKKISFCNEIIRTLGLKDIRAVSGRAEDADVQGKLGTFDAVISRATWPLPHFIAISFSYLARNGMCIAMRGSAWKQELEQSRDVIEQHGLVLAKQHPYSIGKGEARCLLVFRESE